MPTYTLPQLQTRLGEPDFLTTFTLALKDAWDAPEALVWDREIVYRIVEWIYLRAGKTVEDAQAAMRLIEGEDVL